MSHFKRHFEGGQDFFDPLNVHKNENFFGFDFEFCTISLLVMYKLGKIFLDRTIIGGATIVPRSLNTTRNEKNFQERPNFLFIF